MSASGGKADINGAKPDIGSAMSSFGGKPDVGWTWSVRRVVARNGLNAACQTSEKPAGRGRGHAKPSHATCRSSEGIASRRSFMDLGFWHPCYVFGLIVLR